MKNFNDKYKPVEIISSNNEINVLNDCILSLKIDENEKYKMQKLLLEISNNYSINEAAKKREELNELLEHKCGSYNYILEKLNFVENINNELTNLKSFQEYQLISKNITGLSDYFFSQLNSVQKIVGEYSKRQNLNNKEFSEIENNVKIYDYLFEQLDILRSNLFSFVKIENLIYESNCLKEQFISGFKSLMITRQKETINGDCLLTFEKNNEKYVIISDCTGHNFVTAIKKFTLLISANEYFRTEYTTNSTISEFFNFIIQFIGYHPIYNNTIDDKIKLMICKVSNNEIECIGNGNYFCIIDENFNIFCNKLKQSVYKYELDKINTMYLFTDGLCNQTNNQNVKFGLERLQEIFLKTANNEINFKMEKIEFEYNNWLHDKELIDDLLIVCIDKLTKQTDNQVNGCTHN